MERTELVIAVLLVLLSMALGFGLYSVFFHPLSGEVRARYKGGRQRLARWLKTHTRQVLLIAAIGTAALLLALVGIRFGDSIARRVRALIPVRPPLEERATPAPAALPELSAFPGTDPEAEMQAQDQSEVVTEAEAPTPEGPAEAVPAETPVEYQPAPPELPRPLADTEAEGFMPRVERVSPDTFSPLDFGTESSAEERPSFEPPAAPADNSSSHTD